MLVFTPAAAAATAAVAMPDRPVKLCNFLDWKSHKLIYKRYASLFFVCCVDTQDNELITLEVMRGSRSTGRGEGEWEGRRWRREGGGGGTEEEEGKEGGMGMREWGGFAYLGGDKAITPLSPSSAAEHFRHLL